MSIKAMQYVFESKSTKSSQRLMLLAIADRCDDEGVAYPGVPYLAKKCNVTRASALKTIHSLEEKGEIGVIEKAGTKTGHGTTNLYVMLKYRNSLKLDNSEFDIRPINIDTPIKFDTPIKNEKSRPIKNEKSRPIKVDSQSQVEYQDNPKNLSSTDDEPKNDSQESDATPESTHAENATPETAPKKKSSKKTDNRKKYGDVLFDGIREEICAHLNFPVAHKDCTASQNKVINKLREVFLSENFQLGDAKEYMHRLDKYYEQKGYPVEQYSYIKTDMLAKFAKVRQQRNATPQRTEPALQVLSKPADKQRLEELGLQTYDLEDMTDGTG